MWQVFLNTKFCQMSKKIDKFNFPSVYSVSMGEITFLPLKLNKQMENSLLTSHSHTVGVECPVPRIPHKENMVQYGILELTVFLITIVYDVYCTVIAKNPVPLRP